GDRRHDRQRSEEDDPRERDHGPRPKLGDAAGRFHRSPAPAAAICRSTRSENGRTPAAGIRASQKLNRRYATTPAAPEANGTWNQVRTNASRISTTPGPPKGSDRRGRAQPVPYARTSSAADRCTP